MRLKLLIIYTWLRSSLPLQATATVILFTNNKASLALINSNLAKTILTLTGFTQTKVITNQTFMITLFKAFTFSLLTVMPIYYFNTSMTSRRLDFHNEWFSFIKSDDQQKDYVGMEFGYLKYVYYFKWSTTWICAVYTKLESTSIWSFWEISECFPGKWHHAQHSHIQYTRTFCCSSAIIRLLFLSSVPVACLLISISLLFLIFVFSKLVDLIDFFIHPSRCGRYSDELEKRLKCKFPTWQKKRNFYHCLLFFYQFVDQSSLCLLFHSD